eukprot:COSAG01_NODE_7999_length_2958_cov_2.641833_3_plen_173_part_00
MCFEGGGESSSLHWHGRTDWDSRLCAACYGYGNKAAPRPAPPPFCFRRRCGRRRGEERCGACGSPARHSRRRSRRGSPRAASPRPRRPPCWRAAHSSARGRVRAAARAPPPSSVLAPSTRPLSTLQFRLGASPVCDACPGHEHEEGGGGDAGRYALVVQRKRSSSWRSSAGR